MERKKFWKAIGRLTDHLIDQFEELEKSEGFEVAHHALMDALEAHAQNMPISEHTPFDVGMTIEMHDTAFCVIVCYLNLRANGVENIAFVDVTLPHGNPRAN